MCIYYVICGLTVNNKDELQSQRSYFLCILLPLPLYA